MTQRILVVEDDLLTRRIIEEALRADGYETRSVGLLRDAKTSLGRDPFDLLLLDLSLPDGDGLDFCKEIRSKMRVPIIIVTSRSGSPDVVRGLDLGADDYVVKPIQVDTLLARVRAQLRRSQRLSGLSETEVISVGSMRVDPSAHEVTVNGRVIALAPREFDILYYLAQRPGRAVNKDHLLAAIWGEEAERSEKILAVYIRKIREKIEDDASAPTLVTTVRGVGYKLERV